MLTGARLWGSWAPCRPSYFTCSPSPTAPSHRHTETHTLPPWKVRTHSQFMYVYILTMNAIRLYVFVLTMGHNGLLIYICTCLSLLIHLFQQISTFSILKKGSLVFLFCVGSLNSLKSWVIITYALYSKGTQPVFLQFDAML